MTAVSFQRIGHIDPLNFFCPTFADPPFAGLKWMRHMHPKEETQKTRCCIWCDQRIDVSPKQSQRIPVDRGKDQERGQANDAHENSTFQNPPWSEERQCDGMQDSYPRSSQVIRQDDRNLSQESPFHSASLPPFCLISVRIPAPFSLPGRLYAEPRHTLEVPIGRSEQAHGT